MDGSDQAVCGLAQRLLVAWQWAVMFNPPICLPVPAIMDIEQFLNEDTISHQQEVQSGIEAYAHGLQ